MNTAFLFDLDGTITRQELLPIMARALGMEAEFRTLTKLTINGTIPFEDSFRMRFAMLRAIPVQQVRSAIADVELDENIVSFIQENRDRCFVVTGNLRPWISGVTRILGCKVFANDAERVGDQLSSLKPLILKSEAVFQVRRQFDCIVAIGDGANDVPMFEAADIGIAYGAVHPPYAGLFKVSTYSVFQSRSLCRILNLL
jgi:phosphoserine phosphatase